MRPFDSEALQRLVADGRVAVVSALARSQVQRTRKGIGLCGRRNKAVQLRFSLQLRLRNQTRAKLTVVLPRGTCWHNTREWHSPLLTAENRRETLRPARSHTFTVDALGLACIPRASNLLPAPVPAQPCARASLLSASTPPHHQVPAILGARVRPFLLPPMTHLAPPCLVTESRSIYFAPPDRCPMALSSYQLLPVGDEGEAAEVARCSPPNHLVLVCNQSPTNTSRQSHPTQLHLAPAPPPCVGFPSFLAGAAPSCIAGVARPPTAVALVQAESDATDTSV